MRLFIVMFNSILLLTLLIFSTRYCANELDEWSSCSVKCQPGYTYRIRSDDQLIELRSCIEQDSECINYEREKIDKQQNIIQENRRQHLSNTLIKVIILLSVAIGFTLLISSISFIYLLRDTASISSNDEMKTFKKYSD
jgi:hypothetical protein